MPEPPAPRSLADELGGILNLSGQLTAQQSAASIGANRQLLAQNWSSLLGNYPKLTDVIEDVTAEERVRNIEFFQQQGLEAHAAYLDANPELKRALGYIDSMASASALGTPEITSLLNFQALDQLRLGGRLSPEDLRMAQQSAREAYSARGMAMSDSAALAEVLNRDSLSRQRLQEAQGFAASREAGNRAFVTNAAGVADAASGAKYILGVSQQAAGALGAASGLVSSTPVPNFSSVATGALGYVGDLYNTNLNMQASMYNSAQNNAAALQAAQIQAQAQIKAAQLQAGATASAAGAAAGGATSGAVIGAGGAIIGGALIAF